jgi:hypothetical protein
MGSERDSSKDNASTKRESTTGQSDRAGGIDTEAALARFASSFETSARRWELVVYPSLFAFIVLAIYGFYLIFSLTQDMHTLARSMDPEMGRHMEEMAVNMAELSRNINSMNTTMDRVIVSLEGIEGRMVKINGNMDTMELQLSTISGSMLTATSAMQEVSLKMNTLEPIRAEMNAMNANVNRMGYDVNRFTRPETMMMPFFR